MEKLLEIKPKRGHHFVSLKGEKVLLKTNVEEQKLRIKYFN